MKKKMFTTITIIVLIIALGINTYVVIKKNNENSSLKEINAGLKYDTASLKYDIHLRNKEISDLNKKVEDAKNPKYEATIENLQKEVFYYKFVATLKNEALCEVQRRTRDLLKNYYGSPYNTQTERTNYSQQSNHSGPCTNSGYNNSPYNHSPGVRRVRHF